VPLTRDKATRTAIAALAGSIDTDAASRRGREHSALPNGIARAVWILATWMHETLTGAGLGVGDPDCDVMVAGRVVLAETRDIFRTALSVDERPGREPAPGHCLMPGLPYCTLETNPVLVPEAQRWMAAVLADQQPPSR
jgi:hypothetical protein